MSRSTTRKRFFCTLFILILAFCTVVFFIEWNYVEKLKERHESVDESDPIVMPRGDAIGKEHNVLPNMVNRDDFSLKVNYDVPSERAPSHIKRDSDVSISMDEIYQLLKARKQYELRVEKSAQELLWYARGHLDADSETVAKSKRHIGDQYNSLQMWYNQLKDIYSDSKPYQLNWNYWQRNISAELALLMRKRIDFLQNPPDCDSARKLVCHVAKSCGFGCQIHHVSYCLIMAYATKRTLILDSTNWRYSPTGWDAIFQPISSTCTQVPFITGKICMCLMLSSDFHHMFLHAMEMITDAKCSDDKWSYQTKWVAATF